MIDATIGADGALKLSIGGVEHAQKTASSAAGGEAEKKEMEVEKEEVAAKEGVDVTEVDAEQSQRMTIEVTKKKWFKTYLTMRDPGSRDAFAIEKELKGAIEGAPGPQPMLI